MAGRFRAALRSLCLVVLVYGVATVGWAAPPSGESKGLGFKFKVLGADGTWCSTRVHVQLYGAKAEVYSRNVERMQQTAGTIRAIVSGECPQVQQLSFVGLEGRNQVYQAEAWRLARWRLISTDRAGRPFCLPVGPACDKASAGLDHLLRILMATSSQDIEFTSFLAPNGASLVEWRDSRGSVGQMRLLDLGPQMMASVPTSVLADKILKDLAGNCGASGGADIIYSENLTENVSLRGAQCAKSPPSTRYVLIERLPSVFYAYIMGAPRLDDGILRDAARELAQSIKIQK